MLPNFSAQFLSFRAPEQSQEPYAGATGGVGSHDLPSPAKPMSYMEWRRFVGCVGCSGENSSGVGEILGCWKAGDLGVTSDFRFSGFQFHTSSAYFGCR